ncbi:MAG: ice-binding family protein, partial [Mycobacteriales bacterium]
MPVPSAVSLPAPADQSLALTRASRQRRFTGGWLARRVAPVGIVLGASVFLAPLAAHAAQPPVGLGTAASFAVLAGSGITNTGPTTITGDVGTYPTPSETGFGTVTLNGTNHDGDAVTQGAKNDLVTAYNDAAGRQPATNVPVELGGSTLYAGVYKSPSFGLTGTLTLDAQHNPNAEFIFQAGSTLITESNSRVVLLNGADPCNIVWQVGSSATFKTGSQFVGDVLAYTSITAQTSATFQGRLLARNGAVTLDSNTITRSNCAVAASASPSSA